ncbi:MAG: membrane protein insertase YidC [Acidobacteria bacterium]|nr:membrane protein insertase YidC [Acidobacteriota bacterium]
MERRVLLAISLSFLVLFLYQTYVIPPPPPESSQPTAVPEAPAAEPPAAAEAAVSAPGVTVTTGESHEREIIVETSTVRAVFTNRGARLSHWVLKDYKNDEGRQLDLVPDADKLGPALQPFSLRLPDQAMTARANGGLYRASATSVDATSAPASVTFDYGDASGLAVSKTFAFDPTSYIVTTTVTVQQAGSAVTPTIEWGPGLGDDIARAKPTSFFSPSYSTPAQAIYHQDGTVERLSQATPGRLTGAYRYVGVDDHYFAALALNDFSAPSPLTFDHTPFVVGAAADGTPAGRYVAFSVRPSSSGTPQRFFVGPKEFDTLQAVDTELVRVINFGFFAPLSVPLLRALKWVQTYVGNWGWSIIVLTILINIAMSPLRQKSVSSMRKMQEIQPQMKVIQDRYSKYSMTDPARQKMNEEVMALYKAKGVNPASGCVPMLLTFPFLFAFYGMLSQAIELRGAEFFGWIVDLSRPDPLLITPLLMGATMFWQQRITPTSADPVQQKVMMIMPVMFTFMFLSYPSGLVIYWTLSNVWAIGQQYLSTTLAPSPARK